MLGMKLVLQLVKKHTMFFSRLCQAFRISETCKNILYSGKRMKRLSMVKRSQVAKKTNCFFVHAQQVGELCNAGGTDGTMYKTVGSSTALTS